VSVVALIFIVSETALLSRMEEGVDAAESARTESTQTLLYGAVVGDDSEMSQVSEEEAGEDEAGPSAGHEPELSDELIRNASRAGGLPAIARAILIDPRYAYPSDALFLTQKNHRQLRPSDSIKREALLPEVPPAFAFRTCALVGNAGGLLFARRGAAIDAHEAILRINQGPVQGYEPWVGSRTTLRLLNKKWVSVYADKNEGQAQILPFEATNSTMIVTRAARWAFERLAAVIRRERPDLRILFLSNGPLTRARWMAKSFRDAAAALERLSGDGTFLYAGGNSPSSGLAGLYLLLQVCSEVTIYGLGAPRPYSRLAGKGAAPHLLLPPQCAAPAVARPGQEPSPSSAPPLSPVLERVERAARLEPRPPYHYFRNFVDSERLWPHKSHDFVLESDLLHALALGIPERVRLCPPADPLP